MTDEQQKGGRKYSSSKSPNQKGGYDHFDSLNPPGQPEHEETGAADLSPRRRLQTWDSFGPSNSDSAGAQAENPPKKDKVKKSRFKSISKAIKRPFSSNKSGQPVNSKEKCLSQEQEDEPSDILQTECDEFRNQEGQQFQPDESRGQLSMQTRKKNLTTPRDEPKLLNKLDLSRHSVEDKLEEGEEEEGEEELNVEWKRENEKLQKRSPELEMTYTSEEFKKISLQLDKSKKKVEELQQNQMESVSTEEELHRTCKCQINELEVKKQDLEQKLKVESSSLETVEKKFVEETLRLQHEIDTHTRERTHAIERNAELRCQYEVAEEKLSILESELKKKREDLEQNTKQVILLYQEKNTKSEEALHMERLAQEKQAKLDKELTNMKTKLNQYEQLDQTYQELNKKFLSLTADSNDWDAKLTKAQVEFELEEKKSAASDEELQRMKLELKQKDFEIDNQHAESKKMHATAQELKNELEKLQAEHQNLLRTHEEERKNWLLKHRVEIDVLMNCNANLKQELRECQDKHIALVKRVFPFTDQLQQDKDVPSPEKNILQIKNELSLLKLKNIKLPGSPIEKSKSLLELQAEGFAQMSPDTSMHSSAPCSLLKENPTIGDVTRDDEMSAALVKFQEEEDLNMVYESPHTSLTEVAGRVLVNEDNMTDAVKVSIQQEVMVLQNKVQHLQKENERLCSELQLMNGERVNLQSELEAVSAEGASQRSELESVNVEKIQLLSELKLLNADKLKLLKIKTTYFAMVEERSTMLQQVQESECQLNGSNQATHGDSSAFDPIADLKDERILDLEAHLRDQVCKNENQEKEMQNLYEKLCQTEIPEGKGSVVSSGLHELNDTLTVEIRSIKGQLTRAESEQSEFDKEISAKMMELKHLEEENSKLRIEADQLQQRSEYWQQQCERKGHDMKSSSEAAEVRTSQIETELRLCKDKLLRREKKILELAECKDNLDDRLTACRLERDRQHHQIMKLMTIKGNLTKELQGFGKIQKESHYYKEDLALKIAEVTDLQVEKTALIEEIKSLKNDIQLRNFEVSTIKEDFEAERKDREDLATKLEEETAKMLINHQILSEKFADAEEKYLEHIKFNAIQLELARTTWKKKSQDYKEQIQALSEQVELLQTEAENLHLSLDQYKKEADIELTVSQNRWKKEKQDHASLIERFERTFKDLNRVTEQLQSSHQEFHSKLVDSEENCQQLSTENSKIQGELLKLQNEMELNKTLYESERTAAKTEYQKLCDYRDELQVKLSVMKHAYNEKMGNITEQFREEKQNFLSIHHDLERQFQESKEHQGREKQRWTIQLQNVDAVRRTMVSQLKKETQRAEEAIHRADDGGSELTKTISEYQQQLQYVQDRLQAAEYANAQYESDIQNFKIERVKLEREIQQLHSRRVGDDDCGDAYLKLISEKDEIEQQRANYQAKYSSLMDSYRDLRKLAMDQGLKVPKRRAEDVPYPRSLAPSDHNVRPFHLDTYHLQPSHAPMQGQPRRPNTECISGHGPMYLASEQGSLSPNSRGRRGSQDPSDARRRGNGIQENELILGIDHDISEAAANMEEKVIQTSVVSMDDARPLDSNLICPLCGKQFRIGQIQHYRQHVDNCTNKPV